MESNQAPGHGVVPRHHRPTDGTARSPCNELERKENHRVISDYAIANLKEINDSAGEHAPDLEERFAREHLDSEHLGLSYFRYGPGFRSPMGHSHREQEEVYVVVSGSGRIKLNDEIVELRQWDVVRVAAKTVRALEGGGRRSQ